MHRRVKDMPERQRKKVMALLQGVGNRRGAKKILKAVYKDGAVRCSECGTGIWEDVDCSCGVDGAFHSGLAAAYKKMEMDVREKAQKSEEASIKRECEEASIKRERAG